MWLDTSPPASTASMRWPSNSPPCFMKYHQGTPFCAVTMVVSSCSRLFSCGATAATWCAFMPRITRSCGGSSVMSAVAVTCATSSLSPVTSFRPLALTAARLAPRMITLTSCPAMARRTAR